MLKRVSFSALVGIAVWLAVSAAPAAASDTLLGGETLNPGQALVSGDGRYALAMQTDGNLVLYLLAATPHWRALWSTGTAGDTGARAVLQRNGNLVLIDSANQTLWSSNTSTASCTDLVIQEDGNLVLYSSTKAVWATGTVEHSLQPGDELVPGQRVFAKGEQYELYMQADGNLVLYGTSAIWSSGTWGIPGNHAIMRRDGNLVVYSSAGRALWASHTSSHPRSHMDALGTGALAIYGPEGKRWWTTAGATVPKGKPQFPKPAFVACPPPPPPPPPSSPSSDPVVKVPKNSKVPRLARLKVKMTMSWTWNRSVTHLHKITVKHVPAHATITVSCRGRGCPRHEPKRIGRRHMRRLIRSLDGRAYRAGDRLLFEIEKRGFKRERVEVKIRYGALPRVKLLR